MRRRVERMRDRVSDADESEGESEFDAPDEPEKSLELLAIPRQVNEVAGGKAYFLAHWDHFVRWFFLNDTKVKGDPEKLQLLLNSKVGMYNINSVDPA